MDCNWLAFPFHCVVLQNRTASYLFPKMYQAIPQLRQAALSTTASSSKSSTSATACNAELGFATLIRIKFETNLSSMTRRWLFIAITATILHLSNMKAIEGRPSSFTANQRVSFSAPCNSRENGRCGAVLTLSWHLHSGGDWASHPKGQVVHLEWSGDPGGSNLM